MPFVLVPKKFLDVEWRAHTGVEQSNALVDLGAELAEFLHVRKQPPANPIFQSALDRHPVGLQLLQLLAQALHHCCSMTKCPSSPSHVELFNRNARGLPSMCLAARADEPGMPRMAGLCVPCATRYRTEGK